MKKILLEISLFIVITLTALSTVILINSKFVEKRSFKNWETESNNLIIANNLHYDLLFAGISHARNFSRYQNHLKVEKILNRTMINLGQGGGFCGVNEQLFYLQYFYSKNNSVDKIVYVLTPPMLFSDDLAKAAETFAWENFTPDFLAAYLKFPSENKTERIFEYLRTKLKPGWLMYRPDQQTAMTDSLTGIDSAALRKGFKLAYHNASLQRFRQACSIVEKTVRLAKSHQSDVVFIIPPALFGRWPGHYLTLDFALEMEKKYQIRTYDFSTAVKEAGLYHDHHHLNTRGIQHFTQHYLQPVL